MGRAGKRAGTARQLSVQYFPLLPKPASAAGKFVDVPGKFWEGCPAADKAKIFKCIIVEFKAIHDFGGGVKGAGMLMKEMGGYYARWGETQPQNLGADFGTRIG